METPTKQNTLYLTIKQVYFDQIMAGTKKIEYRELKQTTYKKYVICDENDYPLFNNSVTLEQLQQLNIQEPMDLACVYNEGNSILCPREDLLYLDLAVGYNKVRDTATVEVTNITFEPLISPKTGRPARFDWTADGNMEVNDNGHFCYWQACLHLGKIIKKNIVSK